MQRQSSIHNITGNNSEIYIQNACCPMEIIASIGAMFTVSTRHVTESTGVVCLVVKKRRNVAQVRKYCYADRQRKIICFTITAFYKLTIHSVFKTIHE